MRISDVRLKIAEELGVDIKIATLRSYDRRGFIAVARDANGYRNYTEQDYVKMKVVIGLRIMRFGLPYIKRVLETGRIPHVKEVLKRLGKVRKLTKELKYEWKSTEKA